MKIDKRFIRKLISPKHVFNWIHGKIVKKRININLRNKGASTVKALQKIMEDSGAFFFFDMGTLLGIIREGRLLSHDLDIDMAVVLGNNEKKEDLRAFLTERGCVLQKSYTVDGIGTVEDSFLYDDIKFDVNYYERCENYDVCFLLYRESGRDYKDEHLDVVKLTSPSVRRIKKIEFMGTMVCIPENAEEYLAVRYGENWKVPDRKYIYWKGPSAEPVDLVGWMHLL